MNEQIKQALEMIRIEYLRCPNSSDRYKIRDGVVQFMNDIRTEKTEQIRANGGDEILSKLQVELSECSGVKLNYIREMDMNCTIHDMCEQLGLDKLDWFETLMYIEDTFGVEFNIDFEDDHMKKKLTFSDIYNVVKA